MPGGAGSPSTRLRGVRRTEHEEREPRLVAGVAIAFACIAVLAAVDLAGDVGASTTVRHIAVEGAVFLLGLGGLLWMAVRFRALVAETRSLTVRAAELAQRLGASQREAERWRQEAGDLIAGLSEAIDRQLAAGVYRRRRRRSHSSC